MRHTLTIPNLNQVQPLLDAVRPMYEHSQVFCFHGELGAGKTAYIKALCQDLGVEDEMSSPSFGIVNEYSSPHLGSIFHFDLYRLKNEDELTQIGWDDYLQSGSIMFVEWPDKGGALIPDDAIHVTIEPNLETESRTVTITDDL